MARRPNYGGEKRQKELKRQKKKDEKAEKKRLRKEEATAGDAEGTEDGSQDSEPAMGESGADLDGRGPLAGA
jgi:hypothetical protein